MNEHSAIGELRRCVQALAQTASIQISLFPSFACVGDELLIEYDDAVRACQELGCTWTNEQAHALSALDQYLDRLPGPAEPDLYLDPSRLFEDERWERVRVLARAVLVVFNWPLEVPPRNDAIYVVATGATRNR